MRIPVAAVFVLAVGSSAFAQQQQQPQSPQPARIPPRDTRPAPPRTGTGIIRGRVVDGVTGQPLARVTIRLSSGPSATATLTTESTGAFEFINLPAGRYFIGLTKRGYMGGSYPESGRTMRSRGALMLADGQVVERITAPLYRGGAITGRLMDAYGDPMENVSVQVLRAGSGGQPPQSFSTGNANDIGEYRVGRLAPGTYLLLATPHAVGRFDGPGGGDAPTVAPVPTYYPGVLSPDQAQPIVVERAQTLSGMDFQVIEQGVTSVTGTVLDRSGQPATGGNINIEQDSVYGNGSWSNGGSSIKADGTFALKLPPGDYRLTAFVIRRDSSRGGPVDPSVRPAQFDDRPQMGLVRLTVGTEPLANVVIAAGVGSTISGKLTFDGDGPPPDPGRIQINAQGAGMVTTPFAFRRGSNDCRPSGSGKVNADMTFTIEGVRGTCLIYAGVQDPRWRVRSVLYRGVDLLDRPVDLSSNHDIRDVQISLTTRRTELTTDVTGDQGEPLQEYIVLAFSTEKARWTLGRYIAFNMRSATPTPMADIITRMAAPNISSQGQTQRPSVFTTLPPGDYYVIALDDVGIDDTREPSFFEQLVPQASRVTLREGEPQTVTLHRMKMPSTGQ
jgi:hypothetical protein